VHSVADAAAAGPVDYVLAGTVWPTTSKPAAQRLLGIDGLEKIVRAVPFPVLAIGGVTRGRLREIARTGAAGAAGIALFLGDAADECRAARLLELVAVARTV
jgi:thiamine monophosphate synthase